PQRPRWTLAGSIEDARNVRVGQINIILLNDFLRQYVGPNRAVGVGQNVMMEVFVRGPDRYATEQRRREGKSSIPPGYQLFEDARKLTERMVGTLRDWKEFTDKEYCLCYYTDKTEGSSSTGVGGRGNTGNRNTPQTTITGGTLRVRV
ncbi:hypothetical protein TraAM80_10579, partial [Trypanosoma rangeli]